MHSKFPYFVLPATLLTLGSFPNLATAQTCDQKDVLLRMEYAARAVVKASIHSGGAFEVISTEVNPLTGGRVAYQAEYRFGKMALAVEAMSYASPREGTSCYVSKVNNRVAP